MEGGAGERGDLGRDEKVTRAFSTHPAGWVPPGGGFLSVRGTPCAHGTGPSSQAAAIREDRVGWHKVSRWTSPPFSCECRFGLC